MARGKKKEQLSLEEKLEQALVPAGEQPYQVPGNWCWIHLLNAFDNVTDSKKKLTTKEYSAVGEYPIIDQGQEFIGGYTDNEDVVHESNLPIVIFGDHTRCVKYIDFRFVQGADGVKVLKPKSFWNAKAFCYAFQAIEIPNMGYRRHYPLFKNFCIPVPPLAEQQRIVDRIERMFAQLDEAKEKITEVKESYLARKAAILSQAFTGKLTTAWRHQNNVENNWAQKTFGEVAVIKSNLVKPNEYRDFPHIAPDNIEKRTGMLLQYNTIAEDGVTSGKHRFYPGQILYSKIRPYLSKVVMVDFDGLCSADMYPIEAKENTRYLWYYMLSDDFLNQASSAGSRSVLPKINQKELSKLVIAMPGIEEQKEVVKILDRLLPYEQHVLEYVEDVLEKIDLLKKSILSKAFRGQLGTNHPEEESAMELLKSILMES